MNLRQKFGVMALIYVVSLSANLVMSGWCILVYFQSAFSESEAAAREQNDVEGLRVLARRTEQSRSELTLPGEPNPAYLAISEEWRAISDRLSGRLEAGPLGERWAAMAQLPSAVVSDAGSSGELDRLLAEASTALSRERESRVEQATATQQRVVTILTVNTAIGAILCAFGLVFVRRWILRPVADLRAAAQEFAAGKLDYRIAPRSGDELGQLAVEVNQMASTLAQMQTKLVEQERLAAAGEMVTRVAHNIRNPLAGIRGLAESTLQLAPREPGIAIHQQRIIESVDRFEKWLRDLQQSVSPMTLKLRETSLLELVESVTQALRPMAERRSVQLQVSVDAALGPVAVDEVHFEQALVALITNAVQASPAGRAVRITAKPHASDARRWRLEVEDHGAGVAPELRTKIFLPYFTTKPDGNGVGLAMANKVVRIHGGLLTVDSEPGRGSVFAAVMPGRMRGS